MTDFKSKSAEQPVHNPGKEQGKDPNFQNPRGKIYKSGPYDDPVTGRVYYNYRMEVYEFQNSRNLEEVAPSPYGTDDYTEVEFVIDIDSAAGQSEIHLRQIKKYEKERNSDRKSRN